MRISSTGSRSGKQDKIMRANKHPGAKDQGVTVLPSGLADISRHQKKPEHLTAEAGPAPHYQPELEELSLVAKGSRP